MFHNLSDDVHLFLKNDIGVIAENKKKQISFNIKTNVKLPGVNNKDG